MRLTWKEASGIWQACNTLEAHIIQLSSAYLIYTSAYYHLQAEICSVKITLLKFNMPKRPLLGLMAIKCFAIIGKVIERTDSFSVSFLL